MWITRGEPNRMSDYDNEHVVVRSDVPFWSTRKLIIFNIFKVTSEFRLYFTFYKKKLMLSM